MRFRDSIQTEKPTPIAEGGFLSSLDCVEGLLNQRNLLGLYIATRFNSYEVKPRGYRSIAAIASIPDNLVCSCSASVVNQSSDYPTRNVMDSESDIILIT